MRRKGADDDEAGQQQGQEQREDDGKKSGHPAVSTPACATPRAYRGSVC
jgi:hypothetical protein